MATEPPRGTAGTAHDLNNLLQVIMGSLELLKRKREVSLETIETALRATREAAILAQRLLASSRQAGDDAMRARAGETVLLVEDSADVRRWCSAALEGLGYQVLQAADSAAALELIDSPAAPRIDLLFTDIVLSGGMTGRQLADAVLTRRPGLPVLFTTGYPRDGRPPHEKVDLEKPYDLERLASTVRGVIDAAR
jgi:CheY-like chemotaxis protein